MTEYTELVSFAQLLSLSDREPSKNAVTVRSAPHPDRPHPSRLSLGGLSLGTFNYLSEALRQIPGVTSVISFEKAPGLIEVGIAVDAYQHATGPQKLREDVARIINTVRPAGTEFDVILCTESQLEGAARSILNCALSEVERLKARHQQLLDRIEEIQPGITKAAEVVGMILEEEVSLGESVFGTLNEVPQRLYVNKPLSFGCSIVAGPDVLDVAKATADIKEAETSLRGLPPLIVRVDELVDFGKEPADD